MTTKITISSEPRSDFGKGASRRIRRAGRIPAVIYGDGSQLLHISLPGHELELALRKSQVVFEITTSNGVTIAKPRDVQRDPVKRNIEHLDLIIISASEAQDRSDMSDAIRAAEAAAEEAGIDAGAAVAAMHEAIAQGESPLDAAAHAVANVAAQAEVYAEANREEEGAVVAEAAAAE